VQRVLLFFAKRSQRSRHMWQTSLARSAAVALAWTIRNGKVIAIPESGSAVHVKENAVALALTLRRKNLKRWMQGIHRRPAADREREGQLGLARQ
jgi:diketogulonate reductase-like aldo/keto reductase